VTARRNARSSPRGQRADDLANVEELLGEERALTNLIENRRRKLARVRTRIEELRKRLCGQQFFVFERHR
jgi:hypothetical protein